MTTSRGPCPPALAAEVYALTLAGMRKRYRADSAHHQSIPDVVGEVWTTWLASATDKALFGAPAHSHYLILTARALLHGSRRRGGRHARPIASWAVGGERAEAEESALLETLLRREAGASEGPEEFESDFVAALDEARRILRGRVCAAAAEALDALRVRGWSVPQIATAVGVTEQAVHTWVAGRVPQPRLVPVLLRVAATDGLPPTALPRHVARGARPATVPRSPVRMAPETSDALASLLQRHTQRTLARLLGVAQQQISAWSTGKWSPSPDHAAALVRLALTTPDAPAIMAA